MVDGPDMCAASYWSATAAGLGLRQRSLPIGRWGPRTLLIGRWLGEQLSGGLPAEWWLVGHGSDMFPTNSCLL